MTLFVNKATVDAGNERHGRLTWGAAQAGVAAGVMNAHRKGVLRGRRRRRPRARRRGLGESRRRRRGSRVREQRGGDARGADRGPRRPALDPDRARRGRAPEPILPRDDSRAGRARAPRSGRPDPGRFHDRRHHVRPRRRARLRRCSTSTSPAGAACSATCTADVVVAALVFFAPEHRARGVGSAPRSVMPREQAAREWAAVAHAWAIAHLPDEVDWPTVAALLGRVVRRGAGRRRAVVRGLARARRTRGRRRRSRCTASTRCASCGARCTAPRCSPSGSRRSRRSSCARRRCSRVFGWPEPHPDPKPLHDRWGLAEARTDRMFGRNLAVLDDDERAELVEMLAPLAEPAATRHDLATPGGRGRDAARPRVRAAARTRTRAFRELLDGLPDGGIDDDDARRVPGPHRRAARASSPIPPARSSSPTRSAPPSATPSSTRSIRTACATPTSTRCTCTSPTRSSRRSRSRSPCTTRWRASPSRWRSDGRESGHRRAVSPRSTTSPRSWEAFNRYYGTLWSDGVVDDPTKEVGRLRNARVTGCGICKNLRFATAREQGLEEEYVELIDDGYADSALPPRWKLAARLADALIADARVDDDAARRAARASSPTRRSSS